MRTDEARTILTKTLTDRRVSGGERAALAEWLETHVTTDQHRGVLRHLAFDLARENLNDPNSVHVLEWLEDVLKVIAPIQREEEPPQVPSLALFSPGEAILNHLIYRFESAKKSIDICVFTITDDRISNAILDAHRRGIPLRIISDNDKAYDTGSDLFRFREAGIHVKFDRQHGSSGEGHMHHKFAIFDRTHLVNGSYNWTRGAVLLNQENLIDITDRKLVKEFQKEFDRLWNKF